MLVNSKPNHQPLAKWSLQKRGNSSSHTSYQKTMVKRLSIIVGITIGCYAQAQYTVEILHSPLVPSGSSYGAGAGGGQQVGHTNQFLAGPSHALLWSGTANSLVDLHPAGWDASYAFATDGMRQVGWRETQTGQPAQFATLWSGSSKGWVDLHNPTYFHTYALGIGGEQQVGIGSVESTGAIRHALLWSGSSGSVVDLNPVGAEVSHAAATDGSSQVGHVDSVLAERHAALWSGSAASFVDLHSGTYSRTEARGIGGGQQVGIGVLDGRFHAVLWTGSATSILDLNPGKNFGSQAHATNGVMQVGEYAPVVGSVHAALWSGSAASMVDLHVDLPSAYHGSGEFSRATGIDGFGNIVGWARHVPTGADHAVLWKPVPETSTLIVLGPLTLYVLFRRKSSDQR